MNVKMSFNVKLKILAEMLFLREEYLMYFVTTSCMKEFVINIFFTLHTIIYYFIIIIYYLY